jgi:hypothetical protein
MFEIIKKIFEDRDFQKWIQSEESKVFFIKENEEDVSYLSKEETNNYFKVINDTTETVHFLPLDHAVIKDGDKYHNYKNDGSSYERCDFMIFQNAILCLIELKFNLESESKNAKEKRFKEAINQLWNTTDFLKLKMTELNFDFESLKKESFVAMVNDSYPYHALGKNTESQRKRDAYLEKFKIEISLKSEKVFD